MLRRRSIRSFVAADCSGVARILRYSSSRLEIVLRRSLAVSSIPSGAANWIESHTRILPSSRLARQAAFLLLSTGTGCSDRARPGGTQTHWLRLRGAPVQPRTMQFEAQARRGRTRVMKSGHSNARQGAHRSARQTGVAACDADSCELPCARSGSAAKPDLDHSFGAVPCRRQSADKSRLCHEDSRVVAETAGDSIR
jgi:hypothetical protein